MTAYVQPIEAKAFFDSGYLVGFQIVRSPFSGDWYLRLNGRNSKDFIICTFRNKNTQRLFSTVDSAIKVATEIGFTVKAVELVVF